ncbi:hypothetical protein EJ05DRAFT_250482 [Pseudovirgaria hyperparasitica]|uniref:Uncharacterized protein n=1 Tax=Pseudovirgaria hyperparasitica TaxID=470096 RepID=A0A6A6WIL3_9PEZI|nr:uncharacterized protein EJ05DRAFT_250482 [Pseudovirgaria hyperparasitica]KAF2761021.1 hypothetical protein EJ05DRAFT_250482 [Pseudovirgaria hyperparasitica]
MEVAHWEESAAARVITLCVLSRCIFPASEARAKPQKAKNRQSTQTRKVCDEANLAATEFCGTANQNVASGLGRRRQHHDPASVVLDSAACSYDAFASRSDERDLGDGMGLRRRSWLMALEHTTLEWPLGLLAYVGRVVKSQPQRTEGQLTGTAWNGFARDSLCARKRPSLARGGDDLLRNGFHSVLSKNDQAAGS